jgi:hypothetical protein
MKIIKIEPAFSISTVSKLIISFDCPLSLESAPRELNNNAFVASLVFLTVLQGPIGMKTIVHGTVSPGWNRVFQMPES